MAIVLAILSGLVLNLAFAPWNIWPAAYLALGSLFYLLLDKERLTRVSIAIAFGLSFFLLLLHWSGSYVGWFPWVSLAVLQASFFAPLALIRFERNVYGAISFASCLLLVELLRMKFPFGGFGWGRIGHTQTASLSILYPVAGVAGITFTVAIAAALLMLRQWKNIAVVALLLSFSALVPSTVDKNGKVQVLAVQGGVDQLGLEFNQRALSVLRRHIAATEISESAQLVVWPENASDLDPEKNPIAKREISELLQKLGKPLLVNAVERGTAGPLNVSILFKPDGSKTRYIKQDLAPFGEYMPLRGFAERIVPAARRVVDFQPGKRAVIFTLKQNTFATLICFEILDDDLVRKSTLGSSFLVNQTNNATFGTSNQAAQQLQIASARAAELKRDLIAVSTTGFTAHIDSSGKTLDKLVQFKAGGLAAEMATHQGGSIASHLGSTFWIGFGLLAMTTQRLRRLSR